MISGATYCDRHKPKERPRASASKRGYDRVWQKVRAAHLKEHPLCEDCLETGRVTVGVDVHHKVALRKGGKRLDKRNLRTLCPTCHKVRTARGE